MKIDWQIIESVAGKNKYQSMIIDDDVFDECKDAQEIMDSIIDYMYEDFDSKVYPILSDEDKVKNDIKELLDK